MIKLTKRDVLATNKVITSLNVLRRWTNFITEDKYNELAKQALNCLVTFFLAVESEHQGRTVRWEFFPKIALHRAFQKAYVLFDIQESILREICHDSKIPEEMIFKTATKQIIAEESSDIFANFICEGQESYEQKIYCAATKIATWIELMENKISINGEYTKNLQGVIYEISKYYDIPGVRELSNPDSNILKILKEFSKLRNQNRWAAQPYNVECSVLGHLFDTAVWAYFMGLEKYKNEELATRIFFMGIFHDIAETWTKDIPSPIKDKILGFRKATEKFEDKMLQEHLYRQIPQYLVYEIRKVMFEEPQNGQYWSLVKGADYLSADTECFRQYIAGSRNEYFKGAVEKRKTKIKSGEIPLTPACRALYDFIVDYVNNLTNFA